MKSIDHGILLVKRFEFQMTGINNVKFVEQNRKINHSISKNFFQSIIFIN